MMCDLVLKTPQELKRGNEQKDAPAGLQHSQKLAQCRHVVVEMFDQVVRGEQVERIGAEGEYRAIAPNQFFAATFATEVQGIRRKVQTDDMAIASEKADEDSGPAPDVEQAQVLRAAIELGDLIEDEVPPSNVPPVALLDAVHHFVGVLFHTGLGSGRSDC